MNGMVKEKKAHEPFREGPAWQAARAYGIDVSLLEDNYTTITSGTYSCPYPSPE